MFVLVFYSHNILAKESLLQTNFEIGSTIKSPLISTSLNITPDLNKTPFVFSLNLTMSNYGIHFKPEIWLNVLHLNNFKLFLTVGIMFHTGKAYTVSSFNRTHDYVFSIKSDITLESNMSLLISCMFNLPDPTRLFNYGDYARAINNSTMSEGGSLWLGVSYKF